MAGWAVTASLTVGLTIPDHRPPVAASPVALTATVLALGGIGYETIDADLIRRVLGGAAANDENLVGVRWPAQMTPLYGTLTLGQSVAGGVESMYAAIRETPGKKVVSGASGGALVVDDELVRVANAPNPPAADEVSFVVIGDANRGMFRFFQGMTLPYLDYTVPKIPDTPYNVMVVKGEYDGIGDWPDRWWNVLADLNALAATGLVQQLLPKEVVQAFALDSFGSVHYDAMFSDIKKVPPQDVTTSVNSKGGVTTTYLVPTADLPLLRPLSKLGVPQNVVDGLTKILRPIVDSAYYRNDPQPVVSTGNVPRVAAGSASTSAVSGAASSRRLKAAGAAAPAAAKGQAGQPKPTSSRSAASRATAGPRR
jgi:hypothetical protein